MKDDLPKLMRSNDYYPAEDLPEKKLMRSMIARAFLDCRSISCNIRRSARKWLNSKRTDKFSFYWCCIHLGLDDSVAKKLRLKSKKAGKKTIAEIP